MAKEGLHINVYRVPGKPGVWRADIKLNTSANGEGITIRGTSEDSGDGALMGSWWSSLKSGASKALAKARTIAQGLLLNKATAAAFPQYVGPALLALKAMEKASAQGTLDHVRKQLTDPVLRKLARELGEMDAGTRTAMSGGGVCLACDGARRPNAGQMRGAYGLPSGNPHPFAESVRRQIFRGVQADPMMVARLARMTAQQRARARNSR